MQPLKDYLTSTQQYEGILDPNQDQVMNRMTDEMIRSRIREYCTYDGKKYFRNELWPAVDEDLEITKIDKDKQGWYIETESALSAPVLYRDTAKSFYDYCISQGQKIDEQKGFLIEDIGIYFRWRKHSGSLEVSHASDFESTQGLPEELDELNIYDSCEDSKKLDVRNKIKVIILADVADLKISGKGCKNIIINSSYPTNVTVPDGVKIHRPTGLGGYRRIKKKILGF